MKAAAAPKAPLCEIGHQRPPLHDLEVDNGIATQCVRMMM
jgi:hypothetical protein